jgi:DNA polymerase-3 subunit gamma/tau
MRATRKALATRHHEREIPGVGADRPRPPRSAARPGRAPRPPSMSLALARKYRPKNFASVAVQSHVSNTLKGAIARGRVAHGYLLCGPRGTGKTTLARVLAMALNCEVRGARADGEPCGECTSCQRIWSGGSSLDVVEMDAASNRSVEDARELRERAMYAPTGDDRYKVYIVDEAHMLTREAWNALLKILEEPPPRVVFVFATTEPQKIAQLAAPILSRLQRFDLKRIGPAEIRERLAAVLESEQVAYEPDALGMIARAADGGLRDALSLTDQVLSLGDDARVTAARVQEALGLVPEDEFLAVLDLIAERRAGDVFATVARLAESGVDFALFLTGLGDMLRSLLALSLGGAAPDLSERAREALAARVGRLGPSDLLRMLQVLVEAEPRFRKSGQQQLLLEMLLVRFALLDRSVDLEAVLRELGGDGGGSAAAPTPAPRRTEPTAPTAPPPRATASDEARRPGPAGASLRAAFEAAVAERAEETRPAAPVRPFVPPVAPPSSTPRQTAEPMMAPGTAPGMAPGGGTALVEAPAPPLRAAPIDVSVLAARWHQVVDFARAARPLAGTALAAALPIAAAVSGAVTIELQEANDTYVQALEAGRDDVLAAVQLVYPGATRVVVRAPQGAAAPTERLTTENVRAERITALSRRDPVLGAAIDALDLDLVD